VPPRGVVPDDLPTVVTRINALMGAAADPAELPPTASQSA
jgi:hypothetical protein